MRRTLSTLILLAVSLPFPLLAGEAATKPADADRYRVQPGDVLTISVWKEEDLQGDALVQPDGGLSFPLAGEVMASGKSIAELRAELAAKLEHYIPKPVVTVALKALGGNHIYVLGKVTRPGEYPVSRPVDVMQALSLAGGTAPFAAVNDIVVLRRENGEQQAIHFHYAEVERGRELQQNIILKSGDTVVVP